MKRCKVKEKATKVIYVIDPSPGDILYDNVEGIALPSK